MATINFENRGNVTIPREDVSTASSPIFKYLTDIDTIVKTINDLKEKMWESKKESLYAISREEITYEDFNQKYVKEIKDILFQLENFAKIN